MNWQKKRERKHGKKKEGDIKEKEKENEEERWLSKNRDGNDKRD